MCSVPFSPGSPEGLTKTQKIKLGSENLKNNLGHLDKFILVFNESNCPISIVKYFKIENIKLDSWEIKLISWMRYCIFCSSPSFLKN